MMETSCCIRERTMRLRLFGPATLSVRVRRRMSRIESTDTADRFD
jgi:hypothetical protein